MFKILVNHMGYSVGKPKKVVVQTDGQELKRLGFSILRQDGTRAYAGKLVPYGKVASWHTGSYYVGSFDSLDEEGVYTVRIGASVSESFEITAHSATMRLMNAVTYYFKAQRDSGEWLLDDSALPFAGEREGIVDAHGGWYDATGDYGIHLSHLSHSTYYNPQQVPLSAYVFFAAADNLEASGNDWYSMLKRRMLDEGYWGADFLMRMRAPSGSFFRSISRSNAFNAVIGTRNISFEYHGSSSQFSEKAATADSETVTDANYETSMRSGGGLAIAALAIAGRHFYPARDYDQEEYVLAAKESFRHLKEHNEVYTNDGRWNLVDWYCALLAAVELYRTTMEYEYLADARRYASLVISSAKPVQPGMRRLEFEGGLPYFSAADEGLPVVALVLYSRIEGDRARSDEALQAAQDIMRWKIHLGASVSNPFGYPVFEDLVDGGLRTKFFFPHQTTAAPWWQGDNARVASISVAARMVASVTDDRTLRADAVRLAEDCIDWILGQNPYDACMVEGYGRNNVAYFFKNRYDFISCPGGIVNGITSGLDDEDDIEFVTRPDDRIDDNWRWAEQWIPHATWFLYALSLRKE